MIKSKLAITIDTISISLIIVILLFVWLNRYIKNAILSLFVCNFIFILIFIALYKHFIKKYNLSKIKLQDEIFANQCFEFLKYCPQNEFENYINSLINSTKITPEIFENNSNIFFINLKTSLSKEDFFKAHNYYLSTNKTKELIFIGFEQTEDFKSILSNSPNQYSTYNQIDLYELMKSKNKFPINQKLQHKTRFHLNSLKSIFLKNITKNRFKEFLFSGLSLIFISFIIPFTFYYLVISSLLLILSIISLFNKNKTTISHKHKLVDLIKK